MQKRKRNKRSRASLRCAKCDAFFIGLVGNKYCSDKCKPVHGTGLPKDVSTSTKGRAVEMIVAAKLALDGWAVFESMSPNGATDIIAFKAGCRDRYIEVRSGYVSNGELYYSKSVHIGHPQPTEFAVYLHATGEVIFVSLT